jgi:hypothetical protein
MANPFEAKLGGPLVISRGAAASGPPSTNRVIWLKSDVGITKDGSNRVSAWADQSGNGNDVTQATGTDQPLWVDAVLNSLPVIRFSQSNGEGLVRNASPTISQPYSVVAVLKTDNLGSDGQVMFSFSASRGAYITSTEKASAYCGAAGITGGTTLNTSTYYWIVWNLNSTSSEIFVNGSSDASGNVGTDGVSGYQVSGIASGGPWGGDLAELIVYSQTMTAGNITTLDGYFASRYGI